MPVSSVSSKTPLPKGTRIGAPTFVSGMPHTLDVVPTLRGRLITMKDLTTIMGGQEYIRALVFQQFRDITDGFLQAEFGSGVHKDYKVHSSVLFGATREIERYYSIAHALGARLIFFKPQNDPKLARKASNRNRGRIREMRKVIHNAVIAFMGHNVERMRKEPQPSITDAQEEQIGELCDVLAWLGASVARDYRGKIDDIADPEFPTRLANTITKLTQMYAFIYGRDAVNENDMEFARRVAVDNIPTKRAAVLKHITEEWTSTPDFAKQAGITTDLAGKLLDELVNLQICKKVTPYNTGYEEIYREFGLHENTNHYKLSERWINAVKNLRDEIRLGGRVEKSEEENNHDKKSPENAQSIVRDNQEDPMLRVEISTGIDCLDDDRDDAHTPQVSTSNIDQAALAEYVRDEILSKRDAVLNGPKKHIERVNFINLVAANVRAKYRDSQFRNFDALIDRMLSEDKDIAALMRGVVLEPRS